MFEKLEIFRMAQGLATHAAARQSTVAQNVANADTPGYRARDLPEFSETYRSQEAQQLRASRPRHLLAGETAGTPPRAAAVYRPGAASPNGNSVSLESEMMAAADIRRDHDLALTIYQTSLGILRASLGRGR